MARKQADYLAGLLAQDEPAAADAPPPPVPAARTTRGAGTLLARESALARVASGEVRQVTQLLLDPARVRIWPGNARIYEHLHEESCRELIDSIVAEGGQKVPAVVRRVEGDPDHDYEVIAGTRRHWAVSWLRANSYPETLFLAQVAQLDDEAAFRLADLENRARKDVTDIERARNYVTALHDHYGGHLTRMAERLRLSKGWLSKMIKVGSLPDSIIAAFAGTADLALTAAYPLAQAMDDARSADLIHREAVQTAIDQEDLRDAGKPPFSAAEVLRRLLEAPRGPAAPKAPIVCWSGPLGRTSISVVSQNRQGITVRLHAGSGADKDALVRGLREVLDSLERSGRGLPR